jgi:hypothetical protein
VAGGKKTAIILRQGERVKYVFEGDVECSQRMRTGRRFLHSNNAVS